MRALLTFCLYLGPLLLLALYSQSLEEDAFDYDRLEAIKADPPDYVFIGDSNMDSRIHPKYLEKYVAGQKMTKLGQHGSDIAVWYLQFKNFVVASKTSPKRVFIFLHASLLDRVRSKDASGFYYKYLREASVGYDPVYESLFYSSQQQTWADQVYGHVISRFHIDLLNTRLKENLSDSSIQWLGLDASPRFRKRLNARFSFQKFKKDTESNVADSTTKKVGTWSNAAWDRSFLRAILDLADEAELELVFIRIRRRPDANNVDFQSRAHDDYFNSLADYIRRAGFRIYDFSREPQLTRDMYKDKNHIDHQDDDRRKYARIFYEAVKQEFQ